MEKLSSVYEDGCVYVAAYEDGHGTIEILHTLNFNTRSQAEEFVANRSTDYKNLHVLALQPFAPPQGDSVLAARVKLAQFWLKYGNSSEKVNYTSTALAGSVSQLEADRDIFKRAVAHEVGHLSEALKKKADADAKFEEFTNDLVNEAELTLTNREYLWNALIDKRRAHRDVQACQNSVTSFRERVAVIEELLVVLRASEDNQ